MSNESDTVPNNSDTDQSSTDAVCDNDSPIQGQQVSSSDSPIDSGSEENQDKDSTSLVSDSTSLVKDQHDSSSDSPIDSGSEESPYHEHTDDCGCGDEHLDDGDEKKQMSREQMYTLFWTYLCKQTPEQIVAFLKKELSTQYSSFKIDEIDMSKRFPPIVLEKSGPIPEELLGQLRIILGVPIVSNNSGKKKKNSKNSNKNGHAIIQIYNMATEKLIDPQSFDAFINKALDAEQEILASMQRPLPPAQPSPTVPTPETTDTRTSKQKLHDMIAQKQLQRVGGAQQRRRR